MIVLNPSDRTPLYQQLYQNIRRQIESGELSPGEKLPSKRQLADRLKISQNTIAAAYAQLTDEGYIISKPRSGFYVAAMMDMFDSAPLPGALPAQPTKAHPEWHYDFKTNTVDGRIFPFPTWARISREVLASGDRELLESVEPQGYYPLRHAIADYVRQYRGVRCTPEQIVIGAGSEYLIGLVVQLLGRNLSYAVENPNYNKIYRVLKINGASVQLIPLDYQGVDLDVLASTDTQILHLTPSHHFPLGIVMPVGRRLSLLKWAAEAPNRYLLEDDYDSEYRFTGKPVPALQGLDRDGRVIYFNTFTRSLSPSMRISYMILPPELLSRYQSTLSFYSSTVPRFDQHTLHQFIAGGYYERHLNRTLRLYRSRRNAMINCIKHLPIADRITIGGEKAGLHLLLHLDPSLSAEELTANAAKVGIRVYNLSEYYIGDKTPLPDNTLIMGYSSYNEEEIQAAFKLLAAAWQ